jgi:hypothetical protein
MESEQSATKPSASTHTATLQGLAEHGRAIAKDPHGLETLIIMKVHTSISTSTLHTLNVSFHPNTITCSPDGETHSLMHKIVSNCFVSPQATNIGQFSENVIESKLYGTTI